jgi:hypothetical protein
MLNMPTRRSFLDQGGKVSHFNYYANELTARAVVSPAQRTGPGQ